MHLYLPFEYPETKGPPIKLMQVSVLLTRKQFDLPAFLQTLSTPPAFPGQHQPWQRKIAHENIKVVKKIKNFIF